MSAPIPFTWDGEIMRPLQRFARRCDQQFVIGEIYPLAVEHEASARSRGHYFASLTEAWRNLPEDIAEDYPSVEHLRKKLLVRAGYADEEVIVLESVNDAVALARAIRKRDEYAVIAVKGQTVRIWTAKSQSKRAMGAKVFQASKEAVLREAEKLISVTAAELQANAGQAA